MKNISFKKILVQCALGILFGVAILMQTSEIKPNNSTIESLGQKSLFGHDVNAQRKLKRWAEKGLPVAQREIGLVYANTPNQESLATAWLTKASVAGDMQAQFILADSYYQGRLKLTPNFRLAYYWYQAASKLGNANASLMLARMTKYGEACNPNLAISVRWLMLASAQGSEQAMFLLSNAYASGSGVPQSHTLAVYWLKKSAETDYPVAIQTLAMQLDDQAKEENFIEARHLFKEMNDERLMNWRKYK